MNNEYSYNGEWGIAYNRTTKVMTAGFSTDGETFSPDFHISEIQEKDILIAIAICANLYSNYGIIVAPYKDLLDLYKDSL